MTSDISRLVTGEQALLYLRVVVRGHHSAVSEGVRCGQHSCHDRESAETTLSACTLDTERVPALREAASVMGLGVFASRVRVASSLDLVRSPNTGTVTRLDNVTFPPRSLIHRCISACCTLTLNNRIHPTCIR